MLAGGVLALLEKACTDCGIERIHKNGKVYFMDVQVVSELRTG